MRSTVLIEEVQITTLQAVFFDVPCYPKLHRHRECFIPCLSKLRKIYQKEAVDCSCYHGNKTGGNLDCCQYFSTSIFEI